MQNFNFAIEIFRENGIFFISRFQDELGKLFFVNIFITG